MRGLPWPEPLSCEMTFSAKAVYGSPRRPRYVAMGGGYLRRCVAMLLVTMNFLIATTRIWYHLVKQRGLVKTWGKWFRVIGTLLRFLFWLPFLSLPEQPSVPSSCILVSSHLLSRQILPVSQFMFRFL